MKKLRRRNLAEIFKIGKITKKLNSKKGHKISTTNALSEKNYTKRKHLGTPISSNKLDGFIASDD